MEKKLELVNECLHCEYMKHSFPLAQSSVAVRQLSGLKRLKLPAFQTRHPSPVTSHSRRGAFTLIELLVVVAIIAILAALTLSTLGYVNKKGAESRARSEVAALSAAIEAYKLDTGTYPTNVNRLYTVLCPASSGAKVYFEPTPGILTTNGSTVFFTDPWGAPYGYSNFTTYFDLWSTAGGTNTNSWIRN